MVDVDRLFMTKAQASQSPIAAKMDGSPFTRRAYVRHVQRNRLGKAVSTVSTKSTDRVMQSLYRPPEYPHVDDRVTGPARRLVRRRDALAT
jgi:hypothetical protein